MGVPTRAVRSARTEGASRTRAQGNALGGEQGIIPKPCKGARSRCRSPAPRPGLHRKHAPSNGMRSRQRRKPQLTAAIASVLLLVSTSCSVQDRAAEPNIPARFEGSPEEVERQVRAALVAACWYGDVEAVRDYSARLQPRVNERLGVEGYHLLADWDVYIPYHGSLLTPALAACLAERDDPKVIRALARAGVSFPMDPHGEGTLLYHPVVDDNPAMVRALIDAGCSPNAIFSDDTDHSGQHVVHKPIIFCAVKSPNAFRVLLDAGAATDRPDSHGQSLESVVAAIGHPATKREMARRRR